MFYSGKRVPAWIQPRYTRTSRRLKKGHMEATDPTSRSCRNRRCLFTPEWRDEQLVLITGLIFRRKRQRAGGGGSSSAPTWTLYAFALDVEMMLAPLPHHLPSSASSCVLLPCFKYFVWDGTHPFPNAAACPCVPSGGFRRGVSCISGHTGSDRVAGD